MSPRGREPEAGLCLSLPPAQLAEMRRWPLWQGSAQGHFLAVTQAVGDLQPVMAPQQVPVYSHICIFINKAFCSFLLSSGFDFGFPCRLVCGTMWVYGLPGFSGCGRVQWRKPFTASVWALCSHGSSGKNTSPLNSLCLSLK